MGLGTFSCAVVSARNVKCWGANTLGQLGLGDSAQRGVNKPNEMGNRLPVVNLGTAYKAISVHVGNTHVCAILSDSTIKCWGANAYRQLGLGNTNGFGSSPTHMGDALPTVNLGNNTVHALSLGFSHTCAILDDGTVKCWGFKDYIGIGDLLINPGTTAASMASLPTVNLGNVSAARSIVSGYFHTCVSFDAGIKCWGLGSNGQLGIGDIPFVDRNVPIGTNLGKMGDALPYVNLGGGLPIDLNIDTTVAV
jgi:E3 ubiquitin-protein ligase HERC3